MAEMNGMLVTALAGLGWATLFLIEVNSDTEVVTLQALAGPDALLVIDRKISCMEGGDLPGKLVGVIDPEIDGLAKSSLHSPGSPNFLEQDALGVVWSIATEVDVVLMDGRLGGLDDVERIQGDTTLPTVGVKGLGASGKGMRDGDLVVDVNSNVRMTRTKALLIKARSGVGRSHDK